MRVDSVKNVLSSAFSASNAVSNAKMQTANTVSAPDSFVRVSGKTFLSQMPNVSFKGEYGRDDLSAYHDYRGSRPPQIEIEKYQKSEEIARAIADENYLGVRIVNYISNQCNANLEVICRIIEFFNSYFGMGIRGNNESENEFVERYQTICCETVKSLAEVEIANFLYLHSVDYRYEELYKYSPSDKPYHPDFYLPEYDIYLEHFGIDRDGHAPQFGKEGDEKYRNQIIWKRNIHNENKRKWWRKS